MLDVPYELVEHVSWPIYARRHELRTPWRKLGGFKQALLALAHLRKNETLAQVAAGFGVSEATAWRYVGKTVEVLAAWAPGLHEALVGLGEGNFIIIDGTLRRGFRSGRQGHTESVPATGNDHTADGKRFQTVPRTAGPTYS